MYAKIPCITFKADLVIRHNITTKINDRGKELCHPQSHCNIATDCVVTVVHYAQPSNVVSEKSSTFDILYIFMVFSSHHSILNNTAPQEHNITLENSNIMYFLCSVHTDLFLIHHSLLAFSDLSLPCCFFCFVFNNKLRTPPFVIHSLNRYTYKTEP